MKNKTMQNRAKMNIPLTHWYLSDSTEKELYNGYQHDRVRIVFNYYFCCDMCLDKSSLNIKIANEVHVPVENHAVKTMFQKPRTFLLAFHLVKWCSCYL